MSAGGCLVGCWPLLFRSWLISCCFSRVWETGRDRGLGFRRQRARLCCSAAGSAAVGSHRKGDRDTGREREREGETETHTGRGRGLRFRRQGETEV